MRPKPIKVDTLLRYSELQVWSAVARRTDLYLVENGAVYERRPTYRYFHLTELERDIYDAVDALVRCKGVDLSTLQEYQKLWDVYPSSRLAEVETPQGDTLYHAMQLARRNQHA